MATTTMVASFLGSAAPTKRVPSGGTKEVLLLVLLHMEWWLLQKSRNLVHQRL
ncbi:uncharacterized protein G2W53_039554 [Senna tora]|uniref:Uncharacterized protein n=1 Tax=Senna tora TaxID=362788 RepID=A0A834W3P1_9FABA|nr:uncharacterized protein G2W53_039554 [Senna tora]